MAATNVLMPQMGYDMTQGKILRWLKKEGDKVQKGEPVAEIETDKVNIEIEAFTSGTLLKIIVAEGETVPVGQPIAAVGEPGDKLEETPSAGNELPKQEEGAGEGAESQPTQTAVVSPGPQATAAPEETEPKPMRPEQQPAPAPRATEGDEERLRVSPVAKRFAQEQGVELTQVEGTGPGGRITKEDVERFLTEAAGRKEAGQRPTPRRDAGVPVEQPAAAQAQPAAQPAAPPAPAQPTPAAQPSTAEGPGGIPIETHELSRMGQAIARRMSDSKKNIPHFYATIEIDMSHVAGLREDLNRALPDQSKISFNDFVMKAAAVALTRFPRLNSYYEEGKVHEYKRYNVAMAIALDQGLITPVIQDVDQKPLAQVAREAKELVNHAREGKLRQDEFEGATFTISNLGMLGVDEFAAIINPPQAAILAIGAVAKRPVVRNDQLAIATTMRVTLSVDHRVVNGADGARYLQELQRLLEDPIRLLL